MDRSRLWRIKRERGICEVPSHTDRPWEVKPGEAGTTSHKFKVRCGRLGREVVGEGGFRSGSGQRLRPRRKDGGHSDQEGEASVNASHPTTPSRHGALWRNPAHGYSPDRA